MKRSLTTQLTTSLVTPLTTSLIMSLSQCMIKLYVDALSVIYWISTHVPMILCLSMTITTITASADPPRSPFVSVAHAERRSSDDARCWVGVIDQINPPWISVVGERGEEVTVSINHAYAHAQEGDWVLYWTHARVLEPIRSPEVSRERERLRRVLLELSDESTAELQL